MKKTILRSTVKESLCALPRLVIEQKTKEINKELCTLIQKHDFPVVLGYQALSDEVDITETLLYCLDIGKTVLLPKVIDDTCMDFYKIESLDDCLIGAFNVLEPDMSKATLRSGIVSVGYIPGRVFDATGGRIGRGKGYYDRCLAKFPEMYKVGVCYQEQIIEHVPMEDWDVRMDRVIRG